MASDSDGGGGGGINFSPLVRTLAKGAAVTLGGIFSITIISSTAISLLHKRILQFRGNYLRKERFNLKIWVQGEIGSSSSMKKKNGSSSCDVCREKGFYICKLCNGNGTIEWSPLYDPLFINPCLCPTCDGHRIQRCLNCLGSGCIQQAKGTKNWIFLYALYMIL
ncbi:hypothetical protein OSB04_031694 [Centaurea solstitialis]|uniref:Uncharacterized protein n=1 Tax=Centaurea solstitialis TaxID=347529 RepID=A0AA38SM60_9ASTR|nr:hypothetical protein OSB04_031694 [Centaurea solstitialis]